MEQKFQWPHMTRNVEITRLDQTTLYKQLNGYNNQLTCLQGRGRAWFTQLHNRFETIIFNEKVCLQRYKKDGSFHTGNAFNFPPLSMRLAVALSYTAFIMCIINVCHELMLKLIKCF